MSLITAIAITLASTSLLPVKKEPVSYCDTKWSTSSKWLKHLPIKEQSVLIMYVKGEVNDIIRDENKGALTGYTQMYYNLMLSSVATKNAALSKVLSESSDNTALVLSGAISRSEFIEMSKSTSYKMRALIFSMDPKEAKRISDLNQKNSLEASASLLCFARELAHQKLALYKNR